MIEVKLSFPNQAALLAFFAGTTPLVTAEAPAPAAEKAVATGKPARTQPAPEAAKPASTATATESPSSPKATGPGTSTSSSSTPAASVEYPVLQKRVVTLAQHDRAACVALTETFGVKTFKELAPDRWAEALDAVNAKLEELGVPA